jgi:hypothetical protein
MLKVIIAAAAMAVVVGGCGGSSTEGPETADFTVSAARANSPVGGALVVVFVASHGDSIVAAGTTAQDGSVTLHGLVPGTYSLGVSKNIGGQLVFGSRNDVAVAKGSSGCSVPVDQTMDDGFPLALGNTWTFSVEPDYTDTIGIFSTKVIGDVVTYAFGPHEGGHPPYLTRGATAVYCHGWETQAGGDHILARPAVFLDFEASVGATWTIPDWGSVELMGKDLEVTVPAGTFEHCFWFEFNSGSVITGFWYCPGVGPVKLPTPSGVTCELTAYHLN